LGSLNLPFKTIGWLACIIGLTSCTTLKDRHQVAKDIAASGQLSPRVIKTPAFDLMTYTRGTRPSGSLVVYIEGDGYAFRRRNQPSDDPSPDNPVALRLAVKDPSHAVLYIARPCQYTGGLQARGCNRQQWTSHRYSKAVVNSINQAIDLVKQRYTATSIGLIGFSGGGAIAVMAAARRSDVNWLVTVAGNLNHKQWTQLHQLTPLSGSLDAMDHARFTLHLPQLHLAGADDEVVPAIITKTYAARSGNPANVKVSILPGYDHNCCWHERWPQLLCEGGLSQHPACSMHQVE